MSVIYGKNAKMMALILLFSQVFSEFQSSLRPGQDVEEGFTCLIHLIKPSSRGILSLKSSNPFEQPNIDPQYLENENDTLALVKGNNTLSTPSN